MRNSHSLPTRSTGFLSRKRSVLPALLAGLLTSTFCLAETATPTGFIVKDVVIRPAEKTLPIGTNDFGSPGGVEFGTNNFVRNSGNEPVYWRNLHRVMDCGENWFTIDGGGLSWFELWGDGFLSGADIRIYRIVDKEGKALPPKGNYLDMENADHVALVGKTQILPAGSPGYPNGGWVVNKSTSPRSLSNIRHGNLAVSDSGDLENDQTYYYSVVAMASGGEESALSNEVAATPSAKAPNAPQIVKEGEDKPLLLASDTPFSWTPKAVMGTPPYKWSVVDDAGQDLLLPEGLAIDPATGAITGTPAVRIADGRVQLVPENFRFTLKVTDSTGAGDSCIYVLNPKAAEGAAADNTKPAPPTDLKAEAFDGAVRLTWKASPSANVASYRIKRSTAPLSKQEEKVYLPKDAPKLEKFDYILVRKRWENFDMKLVNDRVRGLAAVNANGLPGWYWIATPDTAKFSLVPHGPVPKDMADPGETCMEVRAEPGAVTIKQIVFIGADRDKGNEALWYAQLEPGKKYRFEGWMKQEGLDNGGQVTFNYPEAAYPGIEQSFTVGKDWQKFTYDFQAPDERPQNLWHFGHQLSFTGPGTLWVDNLRVFRYDAPEELLKTYSPNKTILNELLDAQPDHGLKGAHRVFYLDRNLEMSALLSMHPNSKVSVDWLTDVGSAQEVTLPMGLMFDEKTGDSPQTRFVPWLTMQHMLHTEQDWLNFVEYMAAPYDPAKDSPQTKPWAYLRCQQRGNNEPWTDVFREFVIELGNETWHNGVFTDWIGFHLFHQVTAGGMEYGLFSRYIIENMKKSPYWASAKLDQKFKFALGGFYQITVDENQRTTSGYAEDAMKACPDATLIGHANYVGPKWETGDTSDTTYQDDGLRKNLVAYLSGDEALLRTYFAARNILADTGRECELAAYEGGPSGYALPGKSSPEINEVNEKYGKSLATGVAALDAWLHSYHYGYLYQNYYGYGQGNFWRSHTPLMDGFRAYPSWLALKLRNRYASGDLMEVETECNQYEIVGGEECRMTDAFAFRDGNRWSVITYSRKLAGDIPATISMPFKSVKKLSVHKLVGDPRATNRESEEVKIESQNLDPALYANGKLVINEKTGASAGGINPGSIFCYVFETGD